MEIANNAQEEKPSDDKPTKKDEVKMDEVDEHFFECSICLDTANDAVVSMCGHLFCWPCLYKWMEIQPSRACPVCKSAISKDSVIPIYGRLNSNPQDPRNKIPPRPAARRTETMPRQTISDFMEGLGVQLNNIMHPTLTRNLLDGRNVSAINIHDVEMNIGARAVAVNSLNELDETRSSIDDMLEDSLLGIDDNSHLNPDESLGNQSDDEFLAQQQVIAEQRFGEAHDTPSSMEDEDNEFFPDMTEDDSEEAFNLSIEDYEENDEDEFHQNEFHQNEFEHENSTQTDWPSDDEDNF